jgi:hypothetical protein
LSPSEHSGNAAHLTELSLSLVSLSQYCVDVQSVPLHKQSIPFTVRPSVSGHAGVGAVVVHLVLEVSAGVAVKLQ